MSKDRFLSDDERALWDTVTRAVAPLRKRKKKTEQVAEPSAVIPPARPARSPKSLPPAPKIQSPSPLAPLGRRMRAKLARGSESIDDRIDLHGMTQADAHAALAHFLRRAQARGARIVLVITGKGARTDGDYSERGVLRRQVPHWLESTALRPLVVGFESAGVGHGGAGALYVRLRRGVSGCVGVATVHRSTTIK
jgi:DNA-nicking Smr family endonuclease